MREIQHTDPNHTYRQRTVHLLGYAMGHRQCSVSWHGTPEAHAWAWCAHRLRAIAVRYASRAIHLRRRARCGALPPCALTPPIGVTCDKSVSNAIRERVRAVRPHAYYRTQEEVVRAVGGSARPCEAACGDGAGHRSRATPMHTVKLLSRVARPLRMKRAECGWRDPGRGRTNVNTNE